MPLDPQIEALLAALAEQGTTAPESMTVGECLTALTKVRWRLAYELREELEAEGAGADVEDGSEERWLARFMEEFDAEEIVGEETELQNEGEASG